MSAPENPFAFPSEYSASKRGMTLRDWFAGQALAGYCAAPDIADGSFPAMAEASFRQADAMLAARAKAVS